jgi:hypothetical protein
MIERERRRLSKVFARILLATMAAPLAAQACSSGAGPVAPDAGGAPVPDDAATVAEHDVSPSCAVTFIDAAPPDGDTCAHIALAPCGLPSTIKPPTDPSCTFALADCAYFCKSYYFSCHAFDFTDESGHVYQSCNDGSVPTSSPITVDCMTCPFGSGRRPAHLAAPRFERAPSAVGDYFARAAHLEAASIRAFRDLEAELAEHRAPKSLVRGAARAARDEVRHARAMSRLARRFGARTPRARVARRERRSLEAMATENAIEGCVRETYGALVVSWQAAHARDPEIAREMTRIADDETRHAALSWAIARWAESRLDASARRRVARARAAAMACIEASIRDMPTSVTVAAGFPSSAQQQALAVALEASLRTRHTRSRS